MGASLDDAIGSGLRPAWKTRQTHGLAALSGAPA
jgi:hypothetical protein